MSINKDKYRGKKIYAQVYSELITAARYRGTLTYQEIAMMMDLPMKGNLMGKEIGLILGEISEDEVSHGRPMLSSIAVGVDGKSSEGFFNLAELLGKLKPGEDRKKFWAKEKQAVYDAWKVEIRTE